jgi:asparagine synthase (glutamine-hydrolysing)
MCGIAGYFLRTSLCENSQNIQTLFNSIRQRGPDDEGLCVISRRQRAAQCYRTAHTLPAAGEAFSHIANESTLLSHDIAFLHTRYSIIDLSAGGHQPFFNTARSVVATFNGEIYNYLELREELEACSVQFRTASDTEVLVEGYRVWGERLWNKLNGFWAVALYDFNTDTLILSRDRLGVAPLYYRETRDGFYFASSIQSLIDIDPYGIDIDATVAQNFIETSVKDVANRTFYRQIKSIPAATVITFPRGIVQLQHAKSQQFWNLPHNRLTSNDISFNTAVEELREILFNAVEIRLRADVKVAFELSGGLDSSSVVAAAARLRNNDIRTYTIEVPEKNEERFARAILTKYPLDYRVLSDLEDCFPEEMHRFSGIMEEPFHSPNIYTHYKMRQLMKQDGVSVVLSGAGGDEVFAGYEPAFWPAALRELQQCGRSWHAFRHGIGRNILSRNKRHQTLRSGLRRVYYSNGLRSLYDVLFLKDSHSPQPRITRSVGNSAASFHKTYNDLSFHEQSLYHFKIANIPYYLRSNDHFTMAIPLEHRFPFLDYRVVEFGLQTPIPYLFKDGWTKYIVRRALEPFLPKEIVWRKEKMGFPFAFSRFLSNNHSIFLPLLSNLDIISYEQKTQRDYRSLLQQNPRKLWRLFSTALWLDNQLTNHI